MIVVAGWLEGPWIRSQYPQQDGRFWIADGHVWGPEGAAELDTGYWTDGRWIWGPAGASDVDTGFYIDRGWVYGPSFRLPFAEWATAGPT